MDTSVIITPEKGNWPKVEGKKGTGEKGNKVMGKKKGNG
jgi:hypothetical protein